MTEKKRFYKAYCCGDTGVIDGLENKWFIENINSISDIEKNWDTVIDKLNQVAEENDELKQQLKIKVIINKQYEELQNLKNQIKIYELFLDQNDLNIEWDLFCTLNHCVNKEDTGCQTCKYMGLVDSDLDD